MATWNTDKPALANAISADVPAIEENLQELHDLLEHLTSGTLGTTTVTDFNLELLATAHAADHTASGSIVSLTAGEDLVFGNAVYYKSDGKVWKCDADAAATMPVMGLAIATISADDAGEILLVGFARDDTWAWTVGGLVYASETAGGLTQTEPTGGQVQVVGIATHADRMLFKPEKVRQVTLNTMLGYTSRPKFTWHDADEIYIGAGAYEVNGKLVWWSSQLTSDIGSPDASDWYYLYLDDSAIGTASTIITASELVWDNTEPAWSETLHGWYNGNDRCIFAVLTDGSSNILEFFHEGDLFLFADGIAGTTGSTSTSAWTDYTLTGPAFSKRLLITLYMDSDTNASSIYGLWRTNGQTGTSGHRFGISSGAYTEGGQQLTVITDSSQKIELKAVQYAATVSSFTDGVYLPTGM